MKLRWIPNPEGKEWMNWKDCLEFHKAEKIAMPDYLVLEILRTHPEKIKATGMPERTWVACSNGASRLDWFGVESRFNAYGRYVDYPYDLVRGVLVDYDLKKKRKKPKEE